MSVGSLLTCATGVPPSLRTVTRVVRLILSERLSFHSLTEAPSRRTTEPGARFSPCSPQSLKSQRSRLSLPSQGLSSIQPKATCRSSPRIIWMRGV